MTNMSTDQDCRIIWLVHNRSLRLPRPDQLPPMSAETAARFVGSTIITFREPGFKCEIDKQVIDASLRIENLPGGSTVFYGTEWDSPLSPLLVWDVAHNMPVGSTITVLGGGEEDCFLTRSYFRDAFECAPLKDDGAEGGLVFTKINSLPVEEAAGLERWSFCIPVGPGDATLLNAVVKRILSYNLPEMEVILCGQPGENFAYFDKVRIIGLDLPPPPPINISAKKNLLAREAKYENLCILHDRVILPENFMEAVRKFGDNYPVMAFQSLYFDDTKGFVPRRYSDLNRVLKTPNREIYGLAKDGSRRHTAFAKSVFNELERTGFAFSSPLRYEADKYYVTGSMYLVKKPVWNLCPQDENLYWTEFEDVEHGLRASGLGIPSQANVHAFTRSLISRPIFSNAGSVVVETASGQIRPMRLLNELLPVARKPLIKISEKDANRKLQQFIAKYAPEMQMGGTSLSGTGKTSQFGRLGVIARAVYASRFECRHDEIVQFISDFEKLVLLDQLSHERRASLLENFLHKGARAKNCLVEDSAELVNLAAQRSKGAWFYDTLMDYLPPRSRWSRLAESVASLVLAFENGKMMYQPDGFGGYRKAIHESHPPELD